VHVAAYRKSSHSVYQLHYHFVFSTKYRKPALRGTIGEKVRELIREICKSLEVDILKGHVRPDHVHLLLSVPPHVAPSKVMQAIKGKTSHHLLADFNALRKEFWGRHLWARGFFVATTGNVTDEVIARYIETQDVEHQNDDRFKVSG
jgi:putative transposase